MVKSKALCVFFLIGVLAVFGSSLMAQGGGMKGAADGGFLGMAMTTSQTAVLIPFLSVASSGMDGDAALSVSNLTGAKTGLPIAGADTKGSVSIFFYGQNGQLHVYDTAGNPMVGRGLDDAGELGSGQTYTVLLSEIMATLAVSDFSGFAWIVGNFDAVAATATNFFTGLGTGTSFKGDPALGGIPVRVVP